MVGGMITIEPGCFYFIDDKFFSVVKDIYLKANYQDSKRPHYFAFKDEETGLVWMIPCSSRVDKYQKIIEDKLSRNKPTDTIQIVTVFDRKSVLLLQDMFPVRVDYVCGQYFKGGQRVAITDPDVIARIDKAARKVSRMLLRGVRFTKTQPDAVWIKKVMLSEQIS